MGRTEDLVQERPDITLIRFAALFKNVEEAQTVTRVAQAAECTYREWILYELKTHGVKFTGSATDHLRAVEAGQGLRKYWVPDVDRDPKINRRLVVVFHTLDELRTVCYFMHGIDSVNFSYRDFLMVLMAARGIPYGDERAALEYGISIRDKVKAL